MPEKDHHFVWSLRANSEGSGETALKRRLAWAFAVGLCNLFFYHWLVNKCLENSEACEWIVKGLSRLRGCELAVRLCNMFFYHWLVNKCLKKSEACERTAKGLARLCGCAGLLAWAFAVFLHVCGMFFHHWLGNIRLKITIIQILTCL